MKEIELTRGLVALVDDGDFDWLNHWKWYAQLQEIGDYYAGRGSYGNGKRISLLMHRVIMAAEKGFQIDHRNHKTLDNRRANLRICSNRQNQHNGVLRKDSSSGLKGVSWDKNRQRYEAQIKVNGRKIFLGRFDDPREAAEVYNNAAEQHFGEFALLNFGSTPAL